MIYLKIDFSFSGDFSNLPPVYVMYCLRLLPCMYSRIMLNSHILSVFFVMKSRYLTMFGC